MHRNDHAFVITHGSNTATSHLQANFGNFYPRLCQDPCHAGQHSVTICDAPSHTSWHCHAQGRFCCSVRVLFGKHTISNLSKVYNIHWHFSSTLTSFVKLMLKICAWHILRRLERRQKRRCGGDTWRLVRVSHTQLTTSQEAFCVATQLIYLPISNN